jgi:hypothetical protein
VSTQYHVLRDDSFTNVVSTGVNWPHVMPLKWHTLLRTGYEWYLDPDFDRTGQSLPAPMLADEWLTGPERVFRDTLERELRSLQMFIRSQYQRESVPKAPLAPSVTGGKVQYQLRPTRRYNRQLRPNSRQFRRFRRLSPLRMMWMICHRLWCVKTLTATQMTRTTETE